MTLGDRVAVLKRGVLQQLATPRELYNQPVNLFVAGFIGSPPMNFLPAKVDGNQVELPFGTVTIPEGKAAKASDKGLLIAGIRPEHFEDANVADPDRRRLRPSRPPWTWSSGSATRPTPTSRSRRPPEVQEQLHQLENDLDGESMRTQLVISLDGSSARSRRARRREIWVDSSKMHLFDPKSGENLTLGL